MDEQELKRQEKQKQEQEKQKQEQEKKIANLKTTKKSNNKKSFHNKLLSLGDDFIESIKKLNESKVWETFTELIAFSSIYFLYQGWKGGKKIIPNFKKKPLKNNYNKNNSNPKLTTEVRKDNLSKKKEENKKNKQINLVSNPLTKNQPFLMKLNNEIPISSIDQKKDLKRRISTMGSNTKKIGKNKKLVQGL